MDGKCYGLLGRKLGHRWSVPIHQALGCPDYRLIELEPDALEAFLRRTDIGGLNVTIPYKRDVMPYCDEIDAAVRTASSAPTTPMRRAFATWPGGRASPLPGGKPSSWAAVAPP